MAHQARGIRAEARLGSAALALIGAALSASCASLCGAPSGRAPEATAPTSSAAPPAPSVQVPRPPRRPTPYDEGVTVRLSKVEGRAGVVSFGLPTPPGVLADVGTLGVEIGGAPASANVKELLAERDARGARIGVRAVLVQLPAELFAGKEGKGAEIRVTWKRASGPAPGREIVPFADPAVSADSPAVARVSKRTIERVKGAFALVEEPVETRTLFVGRTPRALALFPEGYLAETRILGEQSTAGRAASPERGGLKYLSDAFRGFALSGMYEGDYALDPHPESVPDPKTEYEGWLYDRCATFLSAYAHFGEARFLSHAQKSCSYFADKITLDGPNRGFFSGKPEPDAKYSHARGLYAYYALTGDEAALRAIEAMAAMWQGDPLFVVPYAEGHVRGRDKLWTERLLATSLEGLLYGHLATGETKYLERVKQLVDTAHLHVTGDAAALAKINPGVAFPPQNCFIHTGEQQAEEGPQDPWCSPWMSELLVEPLLRYQAQTGDARVDEIFIRLGRFLRDVGTAYFTNDVLKDSFLAPSVCDDPEAGERRRRLVPLYGAGIGADGKRRTYGEWSDTEHCADATALTAAAMRALKRKGGWDAKGPLPFATEGESLLALHHELSSCAERTFEEQTRARRDPRLWKSAELAEGARDPKAFLEKNRIGFPVHVQSPQRKLSWWFNTSMLQFALLEEAKVPIPRLEPGRIQAPGCARASARR